MAVSDTPLRLDETRQTAAALKARFPQLLSPPSDDICYAAQNRQQAVKQIAQEADLVLVVGSENSSNSQRLVEVALASGAPAAHLIDHVGQIDEAWRDGADTVGMTSGASVPEVLVTRVLTWLAARGHTEARTVTTTEEHQRFALPRDLIPLQHGNATTPATPKGTS